MDDNIEIQNDVTAFACNMNAIPQAERAQHGETARHLFERVDKVRELVDGYAFLLPNETEVFRTAAAFVANERLCCPFCTLVIESEADGGALRLTLKGRAGVKEFIRAELGEYIKLPDRD